MERAYYVVTPDSDKDDDVTSSCYLQNDDVVKKCSSANSTDTASFRLLRAYHTDRRRRAKGRHKNTDAPPLQTAATMTSLPVPVANSHDVGKEVREKAAEVEGGVVVTSVGTSRKEVCVALLKRFVAFLLSTVGLSILTVLYSLGGGALFQALEGPHETSVKSRVNESIDWHVSAMWNVTTRLNILHPVSAPLTRI